MAAKTHVIEIYEPDGYRGPNPLRVIGVGVIAGPDKSEYYLLQLESPFDHQGEPVSQLLVQPRYFGDKIDRAVNEICTVGIIRVRAGVVLDSDSSLDLASSFYWGCGKICPIKLR